MGIRHPATVGPAMRGFAYAAVLIVAVGSVLFGLDYSSVPLSPMRDIKVVAMPAPPPRAPAALPPREVKPVTGPVIGSTPLVPPGSFQPPPAVIAAPPVLQPAVELPPQPKCDVAACAAAYRSFRESDCTYNPSVGPRRLCTKGTPPAEAATAAPAAPAPTQAPAGCNVAACAAAYHTFRESDCTFNPSVGPRQVCKK